MKSLKWYAGAAITMTGCGSIIVLLITAIAAAQALGWWIALPIIAATPAITLAGLYIMHQADKSQQTQDTGSPHDIATA